MDTVGEASRSVVDRPIPPFGNVPKHSGGIKYISDPKAPRLHGGRLRGLNIEFSRQIKPLDMSPPIVKIIDHELHHEVTSPFFLIVALKNETAGTGAKDRHVPIKELFEAKRLVEVLGEAKSLAGRNGRASSVPLGIASSRPCGCGQRIRGFASACRLRDASTLQGCRRRIRRRWQLTRGHSRKREALRRSMS
jgi:hypothetical protein